MSNTNLSWLNLSSVSGSGSATITAKASENTGREQKTGTLTVSAGSITKSITVVQNPKSLFVSFDSSSYSIAKDGETKTITGKTNAGWLSFALHSSDNTTYWTSIITEPQKFTAAGLDYEAETLLNEDDISTITGNTGIKLSSTGAAGEAGKTAEYAFSINIPFAKNPTTSELTGLTLTVAGSNTANGTNGSTVRATVPITETASAPSLVVSPTTITLAADGSDSATITVTSNTSWTIQ